jgi:uncharacterized protein YndB with AHSA1/START domain
MSDTESGIELEYDLDAPPEKVWRALSIPEFRERWLPAEALSDAEAALIAPGEALRYRMREDDFRESAVTFRISPNDAGGTHLKIIHERAETPRQRAANDNTLLMLAA